VPPLSDSTPDADAHSRREAVLPASAAGSRLDRAVADLFPERSRTVVAGWIDAGLVQVDGRPAAGKTRVRGGERVVVDVPPPAPSELVPEERELSVVHEDDDLLVLDKPFGLTVHPGSGRASGTLANALVARLRSLPTLGGSDRPGIVHRLDKDTSGVLLVAKTEVAHRALSRAFAAREVHKEYLAVVHGTVEGDRGRIDLPLGRSSAGRTRMAVRTSGGRDAVTDWAIEERLPRHTVVRCFPVTGRTHQIRVHWRSQDHPIVHDPLYGWRSSPGEDLVERLLLHAHRISLRHPTRGDSVSYEAPPPAPFLAAIAALRGLGGGRGGDAAARGPRSPRR
jgi:23S rRNA pseudouridine1911/1915/1917 synthase